MSVNRKREKPLTMIRTPMTSNLMNSMQKGWLTDRVTGRCSSFLEVHPFSLSLSRVPQLPEWSSGNGHDVGKDTKAPSIPNTARSNNLIDSVAIAQGVIRYGEAA